MAPTLPSRVSLVRSLLSPLAIELGATGPPEVRGAVISSNAEFGPFTTPCAVDAVRVGWSRAILPRLGEESTGPFPIDQSAVGLVRKGRAG